MIAEDRVLVNLVGLCDLDVDQPGAGQSVAELLLGQRAGDAPGEGRHVRAGRGIHVRAGDHVGDREPTAGFEHPCGLGQHPRLVAGEVQHAVGHDHVD